ncbi:multidrug resistance-associated protein 7 [Anoplophora glabripennis]|nr:multidrug resistance-associated protein 7 [Anoplophora glabripennis]
MANVSLHSSPQWRWNWVDLCGEEFKIWAPQRHDLGICFQQLCLDIPVLAMLAISSAYYFGRHEGFVTRGRIQLIAINIRCVIVLCLAFLPLIQIYIDINKGQAQINKISFFLSAVQGITWFTHLGYTMGLRKRLGKSPRGPIYMCIVWSLMLALTVISFRSHYLLYSYSIQANYSICLAYGFSICYLIAHIGYALTLIPSEGSSTYFNFSNRYTEIGENQPLLTSNAYVRFTEEGDPTYLGVAMEEANWFSKLLFYWVNPMMEKGLQGKISNSDDLYDLPMSLNCGLISAKLSKHLSRGKGRESNSAEDLPSTISSASTPTSVDVSFAGTGKNKTTLFMALHRCFWVQFYSVGILKFVADCAAFAGPMLLNRLVGFIEDKSEDVEWGYIYAAGLMSTTVVSSLCDSHFNFQMALVGLRMRGALVTTIYRKTLTVSSTVLNGHFTVGEIVNFMSTDTDRIVNSCPSFHALWSIPFQLAVTLFLLYSQLGISFLAGVVFSVILIPVNKLIASKIGQLSTKLMEHKDARVRLITEVLRGIKAIKLYVWEQHFIRLVTKLRDQELKYLKGRKYLDALCVYFWATTPVVISILTFGTYVLLGNKLSAATVFTGMALLNMLISPLNAFPWVLNGMAEAWVSVKRIQRLLDIPDLDLEHFYSRRLLDECDDNTEIVIREGGFDWGKELSRAEKMRLHALNEKTSVKGKGKGKRSALTIDKRKSFESHIVEEGEDGGFRLHRLNFKIRKGEFVGIIGPVGSGKSSFLSAILGELPIVSGEIAINQIESGFGLVTQQPWLQCGTLRDNVLFGRPYDDSKYRSVLFACGLAEDIQQLPAGDMTVVGESGSTLSGGQKARVALARAVYQDKSVYLLDDILSAVDAKVAKHIFQHCLMGLLLNKTRILCTHHVQYLIYADAIALVEDGSIKKIGKPADVLYQIDDTLPVDLELGESIHSTSTSASNSLLESIKQDNSLGAKEDALFQETSEMGGVEFSVYSSYWKAIGHILSLTILCSIIFMQISRNMTDWWLAHWVTNQESPNSTNFSVDVDIAFFMVGGLGSDDGDVYSYLKVYVEFAAVNTLFTLVRAFLFAYGGVKAATKVHKSLLKSVIKAKSAFFDITPTGRILNRFSSDTYTVDDCLPFILNVLLAQFFGLIGSLVITIYGLPWICMILIPLVPVYHWLQNHYRLTSRELKRISSVTLSPVYSHFNETLQGLTTIRAMRASQRFKRDNEDNVDANIKAQFASQAAARWLGLRLQFIGVAVVAGVSFIAVIQHQYDVADPGLIGLAISYALSVTGALSGVVNAFTETEREMIAVERVNQYIREIPTESADFVIDPPFAWPSQGVVFFNDVVLSYREHLTPSLKGVSFETRPCEKIGVVGRTGAGKSSLISALFRLVEVASGSICIDSVDIRRISLASLRSRMFCIPQDPFLFDGTIRENLDPLGEFREDEIWTALNKVNLVGTIQALGGLENKVDGSGANFSVGQKQLICLARAVLHNAKVLCIDEATANVDHETDRLIQQTLRSAFRKSTVVTIAHRVQTIFDSDRVLVMSDGRVVEFDSPENLLADANSHFSQLVSHE